MQEAYKEALKASRAKEVPVGAVLVFQGKVISRGYNQVELLKDATAHAEMLCLGGGAVALDNWRLLETTLYCTIEPCAMCAGAMMLARIKRLVWGAPDLRHGANGSWVDLFSKPHPMHSIEVVSGMMAQECGSVMTEFFRKRRQEK